MNSNWKKKLGFRNMQEKLENHWYHFKRKKIVYFFKVIWIQKHLENSFLLFFSFFQEFFPYLETSNWKIFQVIFTMTEFQCTIFISNKHWQFLHQISVQMRGRMNSYFNSNHFQYPQWPLDWNSFFYWYCLSFLWSFVWSD